MILSYATIGILGFIAGFSVCQYLTARKQEKAMYNCVTLGNTKDIERGNQ